jgi:phage pi2 protein 07
MDQERKTRLDEIGLVFNPKDKANEKNWNLQFTKLHDYFEKHGHCELFWSVDQFPSS